MSPSADTVKEELLTVRELASYLRLNQRTLLKLASEGAIPGVRLGNQWRFKRALIDAWLDDRMLGVRDAGPASSPTLASFGFDDCFSESHVIAELGASSMTTALGELARLAGDLGLVRDRTWFLGALVERENVLSSAVGHGVAFSHTLRRHPDQVTRPFILLGRAPRGIDFAAPDAKPVRLVFVMGLRYEELHLPWLAKLSRFMQEDRVRSALFSAKDAATLFARLRQFAAS
jgi:excisionase family DNA binding protein